MVFLFSYMLLLASEIFQPRCFSFERNYFPQGSRPWQVRDTRNKLFQRWPSVNVHAATKIYSEPIPYENFIKQISELSSNQILLDGEVPIAGVDVLPDERAFHLPIDRKIEESSTPLIEEESPIEFHFKGRVSFGNFLAAKHSSNGLLVRSASGEVVTIDAGQVISVWDVLADEDVPKTCEDWARVAVEAFEILGKISPRKSDLEEFWRLTLQRTTELPVDSLDLGIYFFQERAFKSWINPRVDAIETSVLALTAGQRYAAALMLHHDDFHFKRRPSKVDNESKEAGTALSIFEGGYRVLDESISMFRQGEVFEKYYLSLVSNQTFISHTFQVGCISRQIRALEMYAMSPANLVPSMSVKHILKRLQKPVNPSGALDIIRILKAKSESMASATRSEDKHSISMKSGAPYQPMTPWSEKVVLASQKLCEEIELRRLELRSDYSGKMGKRGPTGRMDFRGSNALHPVMCIDSKRASFLDDAFSFSPETNEIMVHVADVAGTLRRHEVLQQMAKERVSSTFLPSGPLHMLPPQALDALKLSSSFPNEVITAALKINFTTGEVEDIRIFPSVIGPVFAIDIESADELLESPELTAQFTTSLLDEEVTSAVSQDSQNLARRFGYPNALLRDLIITKKIMGRVIQRNPWIDNHFSQSVTKEFKLDKKAGTYRESFVEKTTGNRMVNALLSLYSKQHSIVNYLDLLLNYGIFYIVNRILFYKVMKIIWIPVWSFVFVLTLWSMYVFLHVHHHIGSESGSTTEEMTRQSRSGIAQMPPAPIDIAKELSLLQSINQTLTEMNKELIRLVSAKPTSTNTLTEADKDISIESTAKNFRASDTINEPSVQGKQNYANRNTPKKAVLFTMDSISSYEQNSATGGAAGEIIIRKSLEHAFNHFNIDLLIVRSDPDFDNVNMKDYDIILLDPWTWAAKGWVPKRNIIGMDSKIYILDFFGSRKLRGSGLNIPKERFLTAFGSEWNTFLGYHIPATILQQSFSIPKANRGVIWGKDSRHYENRFQMVKFVADRVPLVASTSAIFQHSQIDWLGHQTPENWKKLLQGSKFLLGLGDPILGPSAIDAMTAGCMYLNPRYKRDIKGTMFYSQHPYAEKTIGSPYVCSFDVDNQQQLKECIDLALTTDLKPVIPPDFQEDAYLSRVRNIFQL